MSPVPAVSRRVATTLGLFLVGTSVVLGGAAAPDARADTTAVPGVLSLAQQQTSTVSVPVPAGAVPTGVSGRLAVTGALDSPVSVAVGARVAATLPATSGPVSLPVTSADVVDGALDLTLSYAVSATCPSGTGPAPVSLGDLALDSSGAEPLPTTLAGFFPDFSARIDVVVAGRADDALLEAALNAVTSLTSRYGGTTPVLLSSARARLPRVGLGQRLVRLIPADGPAQARVSERFGLPELTLTGDPESLRTAVRALSVGNDLETDVTAPEPLLEQSLADLGVAEVALSGPGRSQETFSVPQGAFGEQVDSLRIRASGVHSSLPADTDVRLDTYVDEVLLDSQVLDPEEEDFSVDVTTDADLPAVSTVEMVLRTGPDAGTSPGTPGTPDTPDTSASPGVSEGPDASESPTAATGCPTGPPLDVVLDTAASTITATPDSDAGSDTGFDIFPQVLRGELAVALRPKAGQRLDAATDAAYLLSSLQGATPGLLDVTMVGADELVDGGETGLLVGADIDDAAELGAPLQYQEAPVVGGPAEESDIDVTRLFSALEAIPGADRDLLVLGAFGPGSTADQRDLRRRTAEAVADAGWSDLAGDLYVASADAGPVSLESGMVRPTAAASEDGGRGWWLAAAVAALLGLLGYQATRSVRADRARAASTESSDH